MTSKALVEVIGGIVIFLTLAGLGLFKVPSEEPTVEAGLRAQARVIIAALDTPPELTVKGRVITVEGQVQSQSERRALEAALRGIDGVDEVKTRLEVLPQVAQFSFSLQKDASEMRVSGYVSRAATLDDISGMIGPVPGLTLARGAPIPEWDAALVILADAAGQLNEADIRIAGTQATVGGVALWPDQAQAVQVRLMDLPDGLDVTVDLTALDDGAPFVLVAERDPLLGVNLRGKLPPALVPDTLTSLFDAVQDVQLASGPVDPGVPYLDQAMSAAVRVLSEAEQGAAMVAPDLVVLTGLRGPAEMDRALQELQATLPDNYHLDVARLPETGPEPFWLRLERSAGVVTVEGVAPRELAPTDLADRFDPGANVSGVRHLRYLDVADWLAALDPVLAGFAEVIDGSILLEQDAITVNAALPDPDTAERVKALLIALPQGGQLDWTIDLRGDGLSPDAKLVYLPDIGLTIAGVLPMDMLPTLTAQRLGLEAVFGRPRVDVDDAFPRANEVLEAIEPWLGEAESLEVSILANSVTVVAHLSPGVDLQQIDQRVQAVLSTGDHLKLSPMQRQYPEGTLRNNVALRAEQVFVAGFWLPVLEFAPTPEECARQSAIAETQEPVRFLSGSDRLDARSIRGVNALSAVARVCVLNGGLSLQVEGHTDDWGAVTANEALSLRRAAVVAEEITKRGIPTAAIDTIGFGPARPIAGNDTAEGRALNRRISLAWQAAGKGLE